MITALIWLIVYLCIAALVYWAASTILRLFAIPEPMRTIINVILVVIIVVIILYALVGLIGPALGPPHRALSML